MAKKSNWELLKSQDERDTTRYRDVYSDQQLERSKIDEKQSPVSRIVLVLIAALFTVVITYLVCCAVEGIGAQFSGITGGLDSSVSSEDDPGGGENVVTFDPEDESTYYLATLEQWKALVGVESHIDGNGMGWKFADGTTCGYTELEDYYQEWLKSVTPAELLEQEPDVSEPGSSLSPVPVFNLGMYMAPSLWKVGAALLAGLLVVSILYPVMMRNLDAQNIMSDVVDINQYPNDQHVALPEEIQEKFDWFPDAGAHCPVQVSSMISHMALSNKGLKTVEVAERAEKDEYDEDGNLLYLKGELHLDENGEPIIHTVPLIDEKFMDALFDASGAPKNKELRKKYDTTKIEYNIGNQNRGKVKDCDYVSDMINKTWSLPLYEPQRPAGAYLVDTEPVNTMVLAITRAGKGDVARLVERLASPNVLIA